MKRLNEIFKTGAKGTSLLVYMNEISLFRPIDEGGGYREDWEFLSLQRNADWLVDWRLETSRQEQAI